MGNLLPICMSQDIGYFSPEICNCLRFTSVWLNMLFNTVNQLYVQLSFECENEVNKSSVILCRVFHTF